MFVDEGWVQIHDFLATDFVTESIDVNRACLFLKLDGNLVNVLFIAATLAVLHEVHNCDSWRLKFQCEILGNGLKRLAIQRGNCIVRKACCGGTLHTDVEPVLCLQTIRQLWVQSGSMGSVHICGVVSHFVLLGLRLDTAKL